MIIFRILSEKLLDIEEFKEVEKYLNMRIEQLSEVVKSLPREQMNKINI